MRTIEQRVNEIEARMSVLENKLDIKQESSSKEWSSRLKYSDLLYKTIRNSGWSMREVARRCNISQSYLSLLCNGEAPPASDDVNQILGETLSQVTDIETDELIVAAYLEKIPTEILDKIMKRILVL